MMTAHRMERSSCAAHLSYPLRLLYLLSPILRAQAGITTHEVSGGAITALCLAEAKNLAPESSWPQWTCVRCTVW